MIIVKSELQLNADMFESGDEFVNDPNVSTASATGNSTTENQADSDAKLFSTLCEIDKNNYLFLFERCKAYHVNARQLRFLEKDHIRRIIPTDQVGILAEFEYMHAEWKKQFFQSSSGHATTSRRQSFQPPQQLEAISLHPNVHITNIESFGRNSDSPTPASMAASVSRASMESDLAPSTSNSLRQRKELRSNSKKRPLDSGEDEHEYLLDEIIKYDMQKVREEYKRNGILTERERRRLAAGLVDFFKTSGIYMSREVMESLAVQISTVFPTESKNTWHDTESGQNRGRLPLKLYTTQRSKKRPKFKYTEEEEESPNDKEGELDETTMDISVPEDDSEIKKKLIDMETKFTARLNEIEEKQCKLADLLAETNKLLRRNLGLCGNEWTRKFPLQTDTDMEEMNQHLLGDKRDDIISVMHKALGGQLSNIENIFSKEIILNYNYDGLKNKKCLKDFKGIMDGLFDTEAERLQIWMRNNKNNEINDLVQIWHDTAGYRTRQLKKYITPEGEHLDEVFDKWPAYKQPNGNILISIDFNKMFPYSESIFYERWPVFMEKIHKLYKQEIKLDLFDQYQKNVNCLNEETKQSVLIHLLHALVRPTRPIHPKQMARRYTIAESQDSFCKIISDPREMSDYHGSKPFLFIEGSMFNVERAYVAFRDVRYEMNFVDALCTCLQIFFIFKLDFPLACLNFWTFIQLYFFNITPSSETNVSVVDHIIKFLLT